MNRNEKDGGKNLTTETATPAVGLFYLEKAPGSTYCGLSVYNGG